MQSPLSRLTHLHPSAGLPLLAFAAFGLMLLPGCGSGPSLYDIPGSITVDGAAVEGANIMFHPDDPKAAWVPTASSGPDGKFHVTCLTKPGIPLGTYKVTVVWPDPSKKPTQQQMMTGLYEDAPDMLKGAFAAKASTPLKIEVTSTMKELPPLQLLTK